MKSIVFVLMVWTHNGYVQPTLEFTSNEKCQVALQTMEESVGKSGGLSFGIKGKCIRIEK